MIDKIKKYISDRPKLRTVLRFFKTTLCIFLAALLVLVFTTCIRSCSTSKSDNKSVVSSKPILASRSADDGIGTWVFNENVTISDLRVSYTVNFTCLGILYEEIVFNESSFRNLLIYIPVGGSVFDGLEVGSLISSDTYSFNDVRYRTITISDTSALINLDDFLTWLKANATYQGGAEPDPEPEPPVYTDTSSAFSSIIPVSESDIFGNITINSFRVPSTSVAYATAEWLYNLKTLSGSRYIQQYYPDGYSVVGGLSTDSGNSAPWKYGVTSFIGKNDATLNVSNDFFAEVDSDTYKSCFLRLEFPIMFGFDLNIQISKLSDYYDIRFYVGYDQGSTNPLFDINYLKACWFRHTVSFPFEAVCDFTRSTDPVFPDYSNLSVSPAALLGTAYRTLFCTRFSAQSYESGYSDGYAQGIEDANLSQESLLGMNILYGTVEKFLQTPFFGTFSYAGLLAAFVGAACLVWILKIFLG